jgi:hypothetical protein
MKPQIVVPDYKGIHNLDLVETNKRLETAQSYKDLSTIIICPTRGVIPAKIVQSWLGLMRPMNQKVIGPLFAIGLEVGEAYNQMIQMILDNSDLSKWKYLLTIEEDNAPPPDGLLKLYESIEGKVDGKKYDVVQGIYWTKGEMGQPMIYGNPKEFPKNFIPQMPIPESVQPCNGLGMGFNLWRLDIFKDKKLRRPWFKTMQEAVPGQGVKAYTQDLYFFEDAGLNGYKFACDTRVRVGHYDLSQDQMW